MNFFRSKRSLVQSFLFVSTRFLFTLAIRSRQTKSTFLLYLFIQRKTRENPKLTVMKGKRCLAVEKKLFIQSFVATKGAGSLFFTRAPWLSVAVGNFRSWRSAVSCFLARLTSIRCSERIVRRVTTCGLFDKLLKRERCLKNSLLFLRLCVSCPTGRGYDPKLLKKQKEKFYLRS